MNQQSESQNVKRSLNPKKNRRKQRFFGVFTQKTLFLGQKVNGKKLTERGGTPLPPLTDSPLPKS